MQRPVQLLMNSSCFRRRRTHLNCTALSATCVESLRFLVWLVSLRFLDVAAPKKIPGVLAAPPVLERLRVVPSNERTQPFHQNERTHPPELLLNALLHSDCTGKVPVENVTAADAPCPEEIHAHLSPFSPPLESSQPPFGNWSVIVS